MNDLLEQAKQAVAVMEGYENWNEIIHSFRYSGLGCIDDFFEKTAELYGKLIANETAKEERKWIRENFDNLVFYVEELQNGEFRDVAKFAGVNRDLPFPETTD